MSTFAKNPELYIDIKFNDTQAENAFKKTQAKIQQQALSHEQKLQQIQQKANVQKNIKQESFEQKVRQQDILHKQKLERMMETHQQRMLIKQQNFQAKALQSKTTWSAKMAKGLETITNSIKGMILAYASFKIFTEIKGAFDWADDIYKTSNALGIGTNNLLAYQKAWGEAGLNAESTERIIRRINQTLSEAKLGDKSALSELNRVGLSANDTLETSIQKLQKVDNTSKFFGQRLYLDFLKIQKSGVDINVVLEDMRKKGIMFNDEYGEGLQVLNDKISEIGLQFRVWIVNTLGNPEVTKQLQIIVEEVQKLFRVFTSNSGTMNVIIIWLKLLTQNLTITYGVLRLVINGLGTLFEVLIEGAKKNYLAVFERIVEFGKQTIRDVEDIVDTIVKIWSDAEIEISGSNDNNNDNDEDDKTFIQLLQEEITERKNLRTQIESNIKTIEQSIEKYKDNADVLKLLEDRLREQKKLLAELKGANESFKFGLDQEIIQRQKTIQQTIEHIRILEENIKNNQGNANAIAVLLTKLEAEKKMLKGLTSFWDQYWISKDGKTNLLQGKGIDLTPKDIINNKSIRRKWESMTEEEQRLKNPSAFPEHPDYLKNSKQSHFLRMSMYNAIKNPPQFQKPEIDIDAYTKVIAEINGFMVEFMDKYGVVLNEVFNGMSSVFNFQTSQIENQLALQQQLIDMENERWALQSQRLEEAGLANTAYYKKLKESHEKSVKDMTIKENEIKSKLFDSEKVSRIAQVVMSTAQAIMQAWATSPLLAPYLTGIIGATSAIQIATINAQKNPYRKNMGGWIGGSGFGDYQPALLTSGEFVVNRESAKRNAELLEAINSGRSVHEGGTTNVYVNIDGNLVGNNEWVENDLIPAINKAVKNGYNIEGR